MENNDNLIKINGVEPPLHLKSEPGKYYSFLINVKSTILNELNTGKILEVSMPNQIEAEQLLRDLTNLNVNDDKAYIMKVENNFLTVQKYFTVKTGI